MSTKHVSGKRSTDTEHNQDELLATTKTDTTDTPEPDAWPSSLLAVSDDAWFRSVPIQILLLDVSADGPIAGLEANQAPLTVRKKKLQLDVQHKNVTFF